MANAHRRTGYPPLAPGDRARLTALVARVGEARAIEILDMPRHTLARAMAGLPVRRATADILRVRLDALAGGGR